MIALLALLVVAGILWLAGVWYANDLRVPTQPLNKFRNVLVIFPHPDDETNVAGTMRCLRRSGASVSLAILTKGECGTPDAHLELSLKAIRSREMRNVARLLGVSKLVHSDFGDGQVAKHREAVSTHLTDLLKTVQPDLVITYDLAGLYGHEDHITCAEIVTELVRSEYPQTALWYSTAPERLLRSENLPTHMAKDPSFAKRRAHANLRIPIGRDVLTKLRTVYMHKSQRRSFRTSTPAHLPIWLVYSVMTNEHFERVQ